MEKRRTCKTVSYGLRACFKYSFIAGSAICSIHGNVISKSVVTDVCYDSFAFGGLALHYLT